MSAVSAAVSAAVPIRVRRPAVQERRRSFAPRPAAAGGPRRSPSAGAPVGFGAVPALLALAAVAAFAVLCLPALRIELAVGWLPLWLLAAPLSAAGALGLVRRVSDRRPALRR